MTFELAWTSEAETQYAEIRVTAEHALATRRSSGKRKSSRQEGLFKQVHKCISLLRENPRHPGLHTHEFDSLVVGRRLQHRIQIRLARASITDADSRAYVLGIFQGIV